MIKLKTQDLLKVYEKAIEMNLERDFIEILELELHRRGVINLYLNSN
ncbi:sporulation histidine kinase inhibitor Sda [Alkalihalobacillus deserti]|nr:sporulation histidine kinase inhibitor Sda [Alkalihalobacillus deserti]